MRENRLTRVAPESCSLTALTSKASWTLTPEAIGIVVDFAATTVVARSFPAGIVLLHPVNIDGCTTQVQGNTLQVYLADTTC